MFPFAVEESVGGFFFGVLCLATGEQVEKIKMILLLGGSDFNVEKIVVNLKLIDLDLNRKIVTKIPV